MKNSTLSKSSLILGLLFCLVFSAVQVQAQKKKTRSKSGQTPKSSKIVSPRLEPLFQSGEVNINVRAMTDRTIKLGLAPGGVTLIEFPSDDFVFARHPGDEDFVTIDKDIIARNNPSDPLVFRPGKGFVVTNANQPSAQITVQMTSGAVFTFQIYAVRELSKSATRVQMVYQPDEIIAEREKLGLPTELQIKREIPVMRKSELIETAAVEAKKAAEIEKAKQEEASKPVELSPEELETRENINSLLAAEEYAKTLVGEAANYKWKFGVSKNGLSLAAQPTSLIENGKFRVDLIAVKNNLSEPISLVDVPSLVIETFEKKGGKGSSINREFYPTKSIIHNFTSDKIIQPNSVYYFAVIADYPVILGVNQELAVSVTQTNAADEPAVLSLITRAR